MLYIKALHIIFMVTWFAGLFYLPRLFVYHAQTTDETSHNRFVLMERRLYFGIAMPGAVLTTLFGVWMLQAYAWAAYKAHGWLHAKLLLVALLWAYHIYCGKLRRDFASGRNTRSHVWYRWFNEVPTLLLVGIVILAVAKPF